MVKSRDVFSFRDPGRLDEARTADQLKRRVRTCHLEFSPIRPDGQPGLVRAFFNARDVMNTMTKVPANYQPRFTRLAQAIGLALYGYRR